MFLKVFAKYGRGSVNLGEVWKLSRRSRNWNFNLSQEWEFSLCPKSENADGGFLKYCKTLSISQQPRFLYKYKLAAHRSIQDQGPA